MHSSTESYIQLQTLYKIQYRRDLEAYQECLVSKLSGVGLSADTISQHEVEAFVKNTSGFAIVKGSPLTARRSLSEKLREQCGRSLTIYFRGMRADEPDDGFGLDDWPPTLGLPLHLGFLASDIFYDKHSRWPGQLAAHDDFDETVSLLKDMLQTTTEPPQSVLDSVHEV